jgi:hypothetical protein
VRGERAWELLDVFVIVTLDALRDKFGKIRVNDYLWQGSRRYAGLRPHVGGPGHEFSMHRYGRAMDPMPLQVTPQEMHAYILAHADEFPHIRVLEKIEDTPTWVHFDTRNHLQPGIWLVNG